MVSTRSSTTPTRGRKSYTSRSPAASRSPARRSSKKARPFLLLDSKRMPFWLYLPNLLGYVRVATLVIAMREADAGSPTALFCLAASLALDYVDGPAARKFDMCTQFGDLLDHVCDHVTMCWLVHITTSWQVDRVVNVIHCVVALGYMLLTGHYFKHASSSNKVTAIVEANNYFNMPSILWNANTVLVPLIKMSYHVELGLAITQSTKFLDVCSGLGLLVTGVYTVACVHAALQSR
mmetsp:Transcript_19343/g.60556  ORF Transcript_19343/g.60556 Transcript_19343/m.60556 type:complete len:236 (+) Transcript_19343:132-839(+)